jgi:hypothetical protein
MLAKDKAQRPTMAELAESLTGMFSLVPAPTRRSQDSYPLRLPNPERELGLAATESADSNSAVGLASTLGQAATPTHPPATGTPRRWLLGGAGVLSLVVLTGGFLVRGPHGKAPPTATGAGAGSAAPPTAAAPARITLGVESDPPGAQIIRVRDGQTLGRTPWQSEQPAQPGELLVRLRLPGYVEREVALNQEKGGIKPVALTSLAAAERALGGADGADGASRSDRTRTSKHGRGKHHKPAATPAAPAKESGHEKLPLED